MDNQNFHVIANTFKNLYQNKNYTIKKKIDIRTIVCDVNVVIKNYKFDWRLTILATRCVL